MTCPTCGSAGYQPTKDEPAQPSSSSDAAREKALKATRAAIRAAKEKGKRK